MDKTQMDFNNLLGDLSDKQFWAWVSGWYDEQNIMDIVNDWDDETKQEEVKELKRIIENTKE